MPFFQCKPIAANVRKISDPSGVFAYLVEGQEKAALLDTCSGAGNLRAFVESLTPKPIVVLCTHGHVDHAGGAFGFDTVYLSAKDYALAQAHTTIDVRRGYVESMTGQGAIPLEDYVPQRESGYLDLADGQVFDLGGSTLEAIALPGHTQGMTGILVRELRSLLLGDGCNPFTFLFSPEASSVQTYQDSLRNLWLEHADRFDTVWFSHGHNPGTKAIVTECVELCDEILAGKADNIPFEFMGQNALIAKAMHPDFSRVDGKLGNIVYNPRRLRN